MKRIVCVVALLFVIAASSLKAADSGIWVTGPSHKVLRNEKAPTGKGLFDPATKTVKLFAAKNEFVSFQIVFPGPKTNVTVEKFALAGPDGAKLEHVELFHEHYMVHKSISQADAKRQVKDCVYMDKKRKAMNAPWEYPVQMVPFNAKKYGAPFDVEAGKNEVVWVDIFVPEKTATGNYTATVKAGGDSFSLRLKVWNFALPSVSHFPNWAYVGPEQISWSFFKSSREIKNMLPIFDSFFQLAHNHRLCLMESAEYGIEYMKAPDRKFYDYYTGTAFKGPFGAGFGYELLPLANDITTFVPVLEKEGWFNRAFVYLMDEPGSKGAYETVLSRGKKVREDSGGRIQRFVTEQYTPSKPDWPHLDAEVDIFCSGGTPPNMVKKVEEKGNVVWTYNSGWVGSMLTDSPGPAPRSQAWCGFITGSRAWFFWEGVYATDKHNRWKKERRKINNNPKRYRTDVWNVALNFDEATKPWKGGKLYPAAWSIRLNGDGLLIYPGIDVGIDGAIGSFRLKGIRRGTQDFEYLYLLEKMGKKDIAEAETRKLILGTIAGEDSRDGQFGKVRLDYEKDHQKWDIARIKLGEILHKIGDKALREKIKPYNQYPNPVGHSDFYSGKRY